MSATVLTAPDLTITVDRTAELVTLSLAGEFDLAGVAEFDAAVRDLTGTERLAIDLSEVSYLDSSAIAALVRAHRRDASFVLCGSLQPPVAKIFEIVGLTDVFARV